MQARLLHIFRNTPLGRETLLQSIYFCKQMGVAPVIYIPEFIKFLMYFENDVVQVDLDDSYLMSPGTAVEHAKALMTENGLEAGLLVPKNFTASTLPDIPSDFDFMSCPRSISDLSSKIGLGYIGPRVRRIVRSARFPVLLTSPVYKPWTNIAVFFGGSANAFKALKLGIRIQRMTGMPLRIFTRTEGKAPDAYRDDVRERRLEEDIKQCGAEWHFWEKGVDEDNFYDIPHDALVVLGAFGHGLIRDFVFGSTLEKVQSVISNNLLIVGPGYTAGR